jgi:hypothetical protein
LHDTLIAAKYTVLRRGWPDFLTISPHGSIFAVEWKEIATGDRVKVDQERMHEALALAGIPTLVTGSIGDVFSFRPPSKLGLHSSIMRAMRDRGEANA